MIQHPIHNLCNVAGQGLPRTQVDCPLVDLIMGHGRALEDVERSPHVSLREGHQAVHAITADLDTIYEGQRIIISHTLQSKVGNFS